VEQQLGAIPAAAPRLILGFTSEMQRYMQLGDFFIGKPGPGSLSEALHMGLPVMVVRNYWTMPQERYNTEWVREQGVGIVLSSFRQVRRGVEELLENLEDFRARVRRLQNRAVYEVPGILGAILASGQVPAVGPWVPTPPARLTPVAAVTPPAG
jgi:1,2-diacylglycerol 3-beta-galactosyltransferase